MLRRVPSALRALGVLVLTGWMGAYLVLSSETPPRGNEITWALLLALGLVAIGAALGSRPVQTRISFLRPPTYDLAKVVSRWGALIQQLGGDWNGSLAESLFIEISELDGETERVIDRHFGDWRPFYDHNKKPFLHTLTIREAHDRAQQRHYKLFWHLDALHGGRDQGVV